ncbi:MarR family winged helix-turn-helix transcriptional regulator [Halodesulfovibrio sp. MK-HDV]|uniref:MarR family winged helix-turn-helix transcriptional regulator n=1 Tax=unclassified Halodesulfovibrio TaxID=2644657 RepID=UPI00136F75C6|nr:MarR family transcriptional regulator [Halodesulfovibrio sp. MK-HDV]KAF1077113.1 Transcriptional regulator SlyA [Halodesulfovibrio sp. MK-HDV]
MKFNSLESVGMLMVRLGAMFKVEFHARLKPYDVTTEQWALLYCLWKEDGVAQSALAECCNKDLPTVHRILKKLLQKKLVKLRKSSKDGRVSFVFLTENGQALKAPLDELACSLEAQIAGSFSDEELACLKRITLERIEFGE